MLFYLCYLAAEGVHKVIGNTFYKNTGGSLRYSTVGEKNPGIVLTGMCVLYYVLLYHIILYHIIYLFVLLNFNTYTIGFVLKLSENFEFLGQLDPLTCITLLRMND